MTYEVKRIIEADFGCEGRMEDTKVMDRVLLVDEAGAERVIEVPDEELYDKDINEGDVVGIDAEGKLQKQ